MTAKLITPGHFTGSSKVFGREEDGLAAIVRGLAIDHARIKVATANPADFTNNSTGADGAKFVDLTIPSVEFDATAAGGAQNTSFNSAAAAADNAMAVVSEHLNDVRSVLGLTALTYDGTVAAADTIAAMTKAITTANGASAVGFASGVAAMRVLKANLQKLAQAYNETMVAAGVTKLPNELTGSFVYDHALDEVAAATASADGADSIAKTVADPFFDSLADNITSLATHFNAVTWTAPALNVVAAE